MVCPFKFESMPEDLQEHIIMCHVVLDQPLAREATETSRYASLRLSMLEFWVPPEPDQCKLEKGIGVK